jgi:polar amino acid transport system substrate-binding protein
VRGQVRLSVSKFVLAVAAAGIMATCVSAAALARAGAGDQLSAIKKRGVLVVATNPQYPPASFLNKSGKWQGFDIDVAQMIGKALGVKVKFLTPSWDVMTAGHWSGRWDIEVGSMDPIPTRQPVLNFVDPPYYYLPASVAVAADAPYTALTDLNGKTIGANGGTTYERYPEGKLVLPDIPYDGKGHSVTPVFRANFKGYDTDTGALQDLGLGNGVRLDGVIAAPTVIKAAIQSGVKVKLLGSPIFYEPLAIGADKSANSASLVKFMNRLVAKWHRDGTLSRLALKWFHYDYSKAR